MVPYPSARWKYGEPADLVQEIQKKFAELDWLDFDVVEDDGSLLIRASSDFSYYHVLEIELASASLDPPLAEWGSTPADERFFVASEVTLSGRLPSKRAVSLLFLTDDNREVRVTADSMRISFDTVYHYRRDDLGEGERLDKGLTS